VAIWDAVNLSWNVDGIVDVKFGNSKRNLEFSTQKLGPMAYVIDRCTDYPYKSWYLRCIESEKALLDIVTKRATFVFEITPGEVKLIDKNNPELQHIVNKPYAPGTLLEELLRSGINLMPVKEDDKLCGYQVKNKKVEERAILEVATSVGAFALRSSVWNKTLPPERVAIGIRLNLEYDKEFFEKDESEWKTFVWYEDKCGMTKLKDTDPDSKPELANGQVVSLHHK
jgi:cancer susceptibility candidate protein 1